MTSKTVKSLMQKEKRNLETLKKVMAWQNSGDIAGFTSVLSPNFVWSSQGILPAPGEFHGIKGGQQAAALMLRTFPGMQQEIVSMKACEDIVIQVSRNWGDQTNGFMGLPPTNKPWEFTACSLYSFEQRGKIKTVEFYWDRGYVLGKLGIIPEVAAFGFPMDQQPHWHQYLRGFPEPAGRSSATEPTAYNEAHVDSLAQAVVDAFCLPLRAFAKGTESLLMRGEEESTLRTPSQGEDRWDKPWEDSSASPQEPSFERRE